MGRRFQVVSIELRLSRLWEWFLFFFFVVSWDRDIVLNLRGGQNYHLFSCLYRNIYFNNYICIEKERIIISDVKFVHILQRECGGGIVGKGAAGGCVFLWLIRSLRKGLIYETFESFEGLGSV